MPREEGEGFDRQAEEHEGERPLVSPDQLGRFGLSLFFIVGSAAVSYFAGRHDSKATVKVEPIPAPSYVPPQTPEDSFEVPKELASDPQATYKLGVKHGLLLAAKGGVSYTLSATGSSTIDVGGLDVTVTGTAKMIPLEEEKKEAESEPVSEPVSDADIVQVLEE
jgi:hypothetical protein